MKVVLRYLLLITLLQSVDIFTASAFADSPQILVIVNVNNVGKLSKKQIKQIYLEGDINFPVKPINMAAGTKIRSVFNAKVIGLTESRIKAYWAQMQFTGRATPPREFENVNQLLDFMLNNPGYIAYVPADTVLPESLTIVYRLNY